MYSTPDEAEHAFYTAFNEGQVADMCAVWLDDDSIVCIHPAGEIVCGRANVQASWERILEGRGELRHRAQFRSQGPLLAVHVGQEWVPENNGVVLSVTNIFQITDSGWRMVLHHASPAPASVAPGALH